MIELAPNIAVSEDGIVFVHGENRGHVAGVESLPVREAWTAWLNDAALPASWNSSQVYAARPKAEPISITSLPSSVQDALCLDADSARDLMDSLLESDAA